MSNAQKAASESAVTQDYVKIIYSATEWGGKPISVTGLAQRLDVAVSTASENVRRLTDMGLVDHIPYRGIALSQAGLREALTVVRRHRLLETYLHDRLGFEWDEVHEEAESLEHAVSDRLIDRIDRELGYPTSDPHGDPIPAANGHVTHPPYRELAGLAEGEAASILRISDHDAQLLRFFEARGLLPGRQVRVVEKRPYAGTILIEVSGEGADESIELAAPAAGSVWVSA